MQAVSRFISSNALVPLIKHRSAVWLDHIESCPAGERDLKWMHIWVLRAELCREILRSGSQRSGMMDRDLPNRSHPSCIISCIIVDVPREIGFLAYLALSCLRVAPDRGLDGRRCGRQDRVSASRSPSWRDGANCTRSGAMLMLA
jgi:hypothetical protein